MPLSDIAQQTGLKRYYWIPYKLVTTDTDLQGQCKQLKFTTFLAILSSKMWQYAAYKLGGEKEEWILN